MNQWCFITRYGCTLDILARWSKSSKPEQLLLTIFIYSKHVYEKFERPLTWYQLSNYKHQVFSEILKRQISDTGVYLQSTHVRTWVIFASRLTVSGLNANYPFARLLLLTRFSAFILPILTWKSYRYPIQ